MYYILDKNKKVITAGLNNWSKMFSDSESRTVALTEVNGYRVSTVFLGLDHGFSGGAPVVFETCIFSNHNDDGVFARYSTWEDAEIGHRDALISLIELPEW